MKDRRKNAVTVAAALLAAVVLFAGCKEQDQQNQDKAKLVFASNYPLACFAETISGSSDTVTFPDIDGDPAFWNPTVDDIVTMQQADVLLVNGATYEKWLDKISISKERIVDTSVPFRDQYIHTENETTHSHGPTGAHSHSGTAFTTWIDLTQAARQAQAIRDALIAAEIAPTEQLNKNFEGLKEQLLSLDTAIETMTKNHADIPLFASHPVYQYFARRYSLNIVSVMWEPDTPPDEAMWGQLEQLKKNHPAAWMIWEDEPMPESVARLEGTGIRSVVFNPCGNRSDQGDFMTVMKSNIENLQPVFGGD